MDENTLFQNQNNPQQPPRSPENGSVNEFQSNPHVKVETPVKNIPPYVIKEPVSFETSKNDNKNNSSSYSPEKPVSNAPLSYPNTSSSDSDGPTNIFLKIGKIFLGLIIVFFLVFLVVKFVLPRFSGNGNNEKVTLTYWGLWEDKRIMDSIISDFERQNPNIKIEYTKEDPKQYRERLLTRTENGKGPDIFRFHNTWVLQLSNLLLPLPEDSISSSDFKKIYYPVVQKDLVKNGAIYGVPLEIDNLSLFVNTEILKAGGAKVPLTWDDFLKIAKSLTVKDETGKIKTSGAALGTFDNITHAPDIISLLLVQNGADLSKMEETSQNVSDALSFYTSFAKGEGNVWDATLDQSILAFAKGNLAMYFGYSWDYFTIKALNPQLQFEVHQVPKLPGRNQTIASYWAEGVSAKSKYKKEAFLFMKFLTQKETEQKFFSETSKTRLFGEPYARIDLGDSLKENPAFPFLENAQNSDSSFFASDTFDNGLNSRMNTYLGNAVRSMLSDTSAQTAVETLSQGVAQILKQYGEQ